MRFNRRDFLKSTALGVAAGALTPALAAPIPDIRPKFHSRHIPIELLNLNTPTGKEVVRNGLCDAIKPDMLKRLRDLGVELIEMRFVWWEIEPEPGRFDWSRALRDIDAVLDAGLKVGMFAWFQYPPTWYDPDHKFHARSRALGSNVESSILSLWDPKTIEVYDRLLGISAEKLKGRLSFVYNAIAGTYGEMDFSSAANHYKFSSPVEGYLMGDRCARASFGKAMQQKYGSIVALNKAWEVKATGFDDDLMPKLPFAKNSLRRRDDCVQWSTGTLLDFADRVCGLYKKHFPGIPGGLPLGFIQEVPWVGQIKSLAAKLGAKHGLTSRWTGCAVLGEFGRSHLLARRLASAAHFYGSPFGTEAALILDARNAANGLYEDLANGASIVHDDPQNIFRAAEVHKTLRPLLVVDPPETFVAVFYPVDDDMLLLDGFSWKTLVDRCAELRRETDFDVCDGYMIADGYLKNKRDIVFPVGAHLREETAHAIVDFAAQCGRVWLLGDAKLSVLYSTTTFDQIAEKRGVAVRDSEPIEPKGVYRFPEWRRIVSHLSHQTFDIPNNGLKCYRTMHKTHESCYFPMKERFEIRRR
jgi:hypothetical protein